MTDTEQLAERLSALERTVAEFDVGTPDENASNGGSDVAEDLEGFATRLDEVETRLSDLEGKMQALAGFASNVESVNDEVERQADVAIAAVDRIEDQLEELDGRVASIEDDGDDAFGLTEPDADDASDDAAEQSDGEPSDATPASEPEDAVESFVEGTAAQEPAVGVPDADAGGDAAEDVEIASDGGSESDVRPAAQADVERQFGDDAASDDGDDDDDGGLLGGLGSRFS